jgi:ABC-type nitrate/sulfonate/bicarbonate transport system ATPase subunit
MQGDPVKDSVQPVVSGEPGTVAITVAPPAKKIHATYHPTPGHEMPKLRVEDLYVSYLDQRGRTTEAVREVSFDVYDKPDAGEIIVILGPSGCGKSTILKAIAGLLEPTQGHISVDGREVTDVGRDRGMVFQQYTSFGWLTVQQNVEYGLKLKGVAKKERRETAARIIEQVGLKDSAGKYPKELSGGMKQRVAIARTLVNRPRILLMDEPFGALDPVTRWNLQSLLLEISRAENNIIIFVTHDVSEAVYLADTVYVLSPRPTTILHQVDIPQFPVRDIKLKATPEFQAIQKQLIDLLYGTIS